MSGWISPYSTAQLVELRKLARKKRLLIEVDATSPLRYTQGPDDFDHGGDTYSPKSFDVPALTAGGEAVIAFEGPSADLVTAKFNETSGLFGGLDVTMHVYLLTDEDGWLHVGSRSWVARFCTWTAEKFRLHVKEATQVRRKRSNAIVSTRCDLVQQFKGALCQYAGGDTRCLGTFDDCKSKSNTVHFRGARMAPARDFRLTFDFESNTYVYVPPAPTGDPGTDAGIERPNIRGPRYMPPTRERSFDDGTSSAGDDNNDRMQRIGRG